MTAPVLVATVAPLKTKESDINTAAGSVSTHKVEENHAFVLSP